VKVRLDRENDNVLVSVSDISSNYPQRELVWVVLLR
jgi:hypothetical protein